MSSLSVPAFSTQNHPVGQLVPPIRRTVAAKVNALAGYRLEWTSQITTVSMVHTDDHQLISAAG
jgi:hypothetical protein